MVVQLIEDADALQAFLLGTILGSCMEFAAYNLGIKHELITKDGKATNQIKLTDDSNEYLITVEKL